MSFVATSTQRGPRLEPGDWEDWQLPAEEWPWSAVAQEEGWGLWGQRGPLVARLGVVAGDVVPISLAVLGNAVGCGCLGSVTGFCRFLDSPVSVRMHSPAGGAKGSFR